MIKVRIKDTWTKAMENQRPKKAMVPKSYIQRLLALLVLSWIVSICQGKHL